MKSEALSLSEVIEDVEAGIVGLTVYTNWGRVAVVADVWVVVVVVVVGGTEIGARLGSGDCSLIAI